MPKVTLSTCLAALFLASSAVADSGDAPWPLACFGTEPFWALQLDAERVRYTPMDGVGYAGPGAAVQADNRTDVWLWRGGEMTVFVARAEACSDGMSDRVHPFEAYVALPDGRALAGCCRPEGE